MRTYPDYFRTRYKLLMQTENLIHLLAFTYPCITGTQVKEAQIPDSLDRWRKKNEEGKHWERVEWTQKLS